MYYKISFDDGRPDVYGVHRRGSQVLAAEIDALVGAAPHTNNIPLMLEVDGWADDDAFPGESFETEYGFTIHCLAEEKYREDTLQTDTPTFQLMSATHE